MNVITGNKLFGANFLGILRAASLVAVCFGVPFLAVCADEGEPDPCVPPPCPYTEVNHVDMYTSIALAVNPPVPIQIDECCISKFASNKKCFEYLQTNGTPKPVEITHSDTDRQYKVIQQLQGCTCSTTQTPPFYPGDPVEITFPNATLDVNQLEPGLYPLHFKGSNPNVNYAGAPPTHYPYTVQEENSGSIQVRVVPQGMICSANPHPYIGPESGSETSTVLVNANAGAAQPCYEIYMTATSGVREANVSQTTFSRLVSTCEGEARFTGKVIVTWGVEGGWNQWFTIIGSYEESDEQVFDVACPGKECMFSRLRFKQTVVKVERDFDVGLCTNCNTTGTSCSFFSNPNVELPNPNLQTLYWYSPVYPECCYFPG